MHIILETADKHSIQAYSDVEIKINNNLYQQSLIVCAQQIIENWPVSHLQQLNEQTIFPFLQDNPRIIIIGHPFTGQFPDYSVIESLAKRGIGIECMSIGAACRTYNVLLSERREVVLGIIIGANKEVLS